MTKRISIATVIGLICGITAWQLATNLGGKDLPVGVIVCIIISYALLGFAIGISALRLAWWLHGMIMGILFSLPIAFGSLTSPTPTTAFIWTIVTGVIYGLIIELATTVVLKAEKT